MRRAMSQRDHWCLQAGGRVGRLGWAGLFGSGQPLLGSYPAENQVLERARGQELPTLKLETQ